MSLSPLPIASHGASLHTVPEGPPDPFESARGNSWKRTAGKPHALSEAQHTYTLLFRQTGL